DHLGPGRDAGARAALARVQEAGCAEIVSQSLYLPVQPGGLHPRGHEPVPVPPCLRNCASAAPDRQLRAIHSQLNQPKSAMIGLEHPYEHQEQLGEAFSFVNKGKGKGKLDAQAFLQGMHYMSQQLQPDLLEGLTAQMGIFAAQVRSAGGMFEG
ncbi:unnamed protein product, partial [Prorocentrum cordatum]